MNDPRTELEFPCDRCSEVAHLHPNRPGELLCRPCRDAARGADHRERTTR